MIITRWFFILSLVCFGKTLISQVDYSWWNQLHKWDGETYWTAYLITSPRYFGPNALAIPTLQNGLISEKSFAKLDLENHKYTGDNTTNIRTEALIKLFDPRVALRMFIVPVEFYEFDTKTRDERRARDFDGQGTAVGDLYLGTQIQILQNHKIVPDILFEFYLKTASGTNDEAARFMDMPGYYLDFSIGKDINFTNENNFTIRPHIMLGIMVWQTNFDRLPQNDALLYGVGLDFNYKNFSSRIAYGGFEGYKGNGDHPEALRFRIGYKPLENLQLGLRYQKGYLDLLYDSWRFSTTYFFD